MTRERVLLLAELRALERALSGGVDKYTDYECSYLLFKSRKIISKALKELEKDD